MKRLKPTKNAGYDQDTLDRMAASDANLRGIIAGRRRAAQALLPATQEPAQEVYDNTAALLPGEPPVAPQKPAP